MTSRLPVVGGLFLTFGLCLSAQGPIDTLPQWNGSQFISSFGVVNTATYGQTITIAGGPSVTLSAFTFQIGFCSNAVNLRGHVYAWNGVQATGTSLYDSGVVNVPAGNTFTPVTFTTGAVSLGPGQYVFFASTSEDQTGALNSSCRWGSTGSNTAYAGGQFVFQNNGTATGQWSSNAWSTIAQDLAFQATISGGANPVPTLSEWGMILLSTLLAGAGYHFLQSRARLQHSLE